MRTVVIVALLLLLFCAYSWLPWQLSVFQKYNSPDETANAFFIHAFRTNRTLVVQEPLNNDAPLVGPRSMRITTDGSAPGGFLGLPLFYGVLSIATGGRWVDFFTPFFATIALVFFYLLMRNAFHHRRLAFLATFLLAFHPMYWYYASRSLFPNELFVVLSIIGAFLLSVFFRTQKAVVGASSALLIGFSLIVRTSEAAWVVPVLVVFFFAFRRQLRPWSFVVFWACFVVMILSLFVLNTAVYGGPLTFGHQAPPVASAERAVTLVESGARWFQPFGLEAGRAVATSATNLFVLFPWYAIPFVIGCGMLFRAWRKRKLARVQKVLVFSSVLLAVWFTLYYGSYPQETVSQDGAIVLASSSIRFFLPLFVLMVPLAALAFFNGLFRSRQRSLRAFVVLLLCLVPVLSLSLLWTDRFHGLSEIARYAKENRSAADEIMGRTEENAIIITGYGDKLVFPDRQVVVSLPDNREDNRSAIASLIASAPVYLYDAQLTPKEFRLREKIEDTGLSLRQLYDFPSGDILYRVVPAL